MDKIVDSLDSAYQEFVNGIANLLEATENNGGEKRADSAIESLAQKWESFKVACDNADMFVNCAKQRIACKSAVDVEIYERSLRDLVVDGGVYKDGDIILEDDERELNGVHMKECDQEDDDKKEKVGEEDDTFEGIGDQL